MGAEKQDFYQTVYKCLMECDVDRKLQAALALQKAYQLGQLERVSSTRALAIDMPGRPAKPELVLPKQVKQRKLNTPEGRAALLHAVAHIEFNAINLALDAAYRFRDMPEHYYADWLQVAAEEAYHFDLVRERMRELGAEYGEMPAHNGLWEQARRTDYDVMVRMALVPRVLEARGLDVTPSMIARLKQEHDQKTIDVLEIILKDEIGHVRIGSYWFQYCCHERGLEPEATFRQLLCEVLHAPVRGPLYNEGRLQAGFSAQELEQLRLLEENWVEEITRPSAA